MPVKEPSWWYADGQHWQTAVLTPLSHVYGAIAGGRLERATPYRSRLPVICVGNLTAGGTGKTPLALLLAGVLRNLGREPWFLSRGYGGRIAGPVCVDPTTHSAADVGDEPLLLATTAAAVIARNRRTGAQFIESAAPANAVIIMDDGLQNPSLAKSFTIAVVDGGRGLGNGLVIPAGPLRAPLNVQTKRTDAIIVMGQANVAVRADIAALQNRFGNRLLHARSAPVGDTGWLNGANVVAFAGIANPDRFFTTLESLGARIAQRIAFADHHAFTESDAATLVSAAGRHNATLITTEKDIARLAGAVGTCATLRARAKTLPVTLNFDDGDLARLTAMIDAAVKRAAAQP